jgi:hypothetical protein
VVAFSSHSLCCISNVACYYNRAILYRPPLWSGGQSSWLQIQRFWFDSRRYQIFWEVVGLERGSLSLVSTTDLVQERKNISSGLENREYGRRDPSRWPRGTLYPWKLTSGGLSRTQTTEFSLVLAILCKLMCYSSAEESDRDHSHNLSSEDVCVSSLKESSRVWVSLMCCNRKHKIVYF